AEEIAEAPLFDVLGEPVHRLVVLERAVEPRRRADEPTGASELNQRIVLGAPAERILVTLELLVHEQRTLGELAHDVTIGVLHPTPGVLLELGLEAPVRVHGADELDLVRVLVASELALVRLVVVLAERGRHVDDARTRVERDEVREDDAEIERVLAAAAERDAPLAEA